ncbi:SH3 domain-containing protein [Brucepastera parasyntrophica]|uniref:SH3 domain-containing protein n=1 Tax=Brucepastera parasyntrophica TaxID=2880008 RepID=UPI00210C43F0|nr:SH3 domain-containing protein [Brucepastera parasyntrophica]ULQ61177.1 SH3 domain-containing protein [Brucepastera parasyntrophica]
MWTSSEGRYGGKYYDVPHPFITDKPAELVVVRNYLKYFGRLNDDRVRLRAEPSTNAAVVGTYPVKTGFRILEKGTREETIAGDTDVWYKVRLLDGTEGWFFGAFVHNLYDGPDGSPPPWPNVPDW